MLWGRKHKVLVEAEEHWPSTLWRPLHSSLWAGRDAREAAHFTDKETEALREGSLPKVLFSSADNNTGVSCIKKTQPIIMLTCK